MKRVRGWYCIKIHFCVIQRRGQIVVQLCKYEESEGEGEDESEGEGEKRVRERVRLRARERVRRRGERGE